VLHQQKKLSDDVAAFNQVAAERHATLIERLDRHLSGGANDAVDDDGACANSVHAWKNRALSAEARLQSAEAKLAQREDGKLAQREEGSVALACRGSVAGVQSGLAVVQSDQIAALGLCDGQRECVCKVHAAQKLDLPVLLASKDAVEDFMKGTCTCSASPEVLSRYRKQFPCLVRAVEHVEGARSGTLLDALAHMGNVYKQAVLHVHPDVQLRQSAFSRCPDIQSACATFFVS
jgi:hypothetical protein